MDATRLLKLNEELNFESQELMRVKNGEYAVSTDALYNFKSAARSAGITPLQAWLVHFEKQVSAIQSYVRGNRNISDALRSRVLDVRNYTTLLMALVEDEVMDDKILEDKIIAMKYHPDRVITDDPEIAGCQLHDMRCFPTYNKTGSEVADFLKQEEIIGNGWLKQEEHVPADYDPKTGSEVADFLIRAASQIPDERSKNEQKAIR